MKPELSGKIWPWNAEPPSSAAMHVHTYMAVTLPRILGQEVEKERKRYIFQAD